MARQSKQAGFKLYQPAGLQIKRSLVKAGVSGAKKMTLADVAGHLIKKHPELSSMDRTAMIAELWWEHKDRQVVFVPDAAFMQMLMNTTFSVDGLKANFTLPHSSFVLAMPKGMTVNGIALPSALIHLNRAAGRVERLDKVRSLVGIPELNHGRDESLEDVVNLQFVDESDVKGSMVQYTLSMAQIGAVLKARDAAEYEEIVGRLPPEHLNERSVDLSDRDNEIAFALTRITAGLGAFLSASEATLTEGLPNKGKVALHGREPGLIYRFTRLAGEKLPDLAPREGLGVRSAHLRQLRDERYYQGEYAKMPAGSRWVFVRSATIGGYTPTTVETSE